MDTFPFDSAAALIPAHPGLTECLQYQVVGLVTVLATLAALWLICELVGMAFRATRIREETPPDGHDAPEDEPEQSAVHAAIMAAVHETLGPGHRIVSAAPVAATPAGANEDAIAARAAIIAAVHVALGPGHRVVSVRLSHDASRSAWSSEGRREHFQSHKLR
ncbi:MAG TPA: OadG family protein [Verrucomicrobiae bacterium]|nr:OadG family protein [Verrucomicrobiae bacterium]